jgi:Uma2 family endonuclease
MPATAHKPVTADQLLKMGDIGRCELIYGELIMMSPAGFDHGEIALRLGYLLAAYNEGHGLGVVLAAETGFYLARKPDLVRAPDVSFVKKSRVPKGGWKKFFPGAPDLAVEVLSPDDTRRQVSEKVDTWLAHGTVSVWVVDPDEQTVTIHRTGREPIRLTMRDKIAHEPALPGFSLPVARVFRRP